MASSSSNPSVSNDMDQLVQLQRSGLLSMSEFVRMSREFNKTDAMRLEDAPQVQIHDGVPFDNASATESSGSEMLVSESGDIFDAAQNVHEGGSDAADGASGGEGGSASAGSFDEGIGWFDDEPEEMVPNELVLEFPIGSPVIVDRGGKWSGVVTNYGHDATLPICR